MATSVSVDDDFVDLGGDSLAASRLALRIEREFGVRLELGTLFQTPTVARLAEVIAQRASVKEWECLVPLQPRGHRHPFFCIHNYNGEVWLYLELARRLAPDQPVYGLQAVGVNRPCPPLRRVEQMAERYIAEIRSVQPRGPYHVGGICFGAYVALEIARQLVESGERVGLLASFDTFADGSESLNGSRPGLAGRWRKLSSELDPRKPCAALHNARAILQNRYSQARRRAGLVAAQLHLRSHKAIGDQTRRDLLTALNARARVRYRPQTYPGKVTLIRSDSNQGRDAGQFWGRVAAGGVECVPVQGDHVGIIEGPYVGNLAAVLRECLRNAGR